VYRRASRQTHRSGCARAQARNDSVRDGSTLALTSVRNPPCAAAKSAASSSANSSSMRSVCVRRRRGSFTRSNEGGTAIIDTTLQRTGVSLALYRANRSYGAARLSGLRPAPRDRRQRKIEDEQTRTQLDRVVTLQRRTHEGPVLLRLELTDHPVCEAVNFVGPLLSDILIGFSVFRAGVCPAARIRRCSRETRAITGAATLPSRRATHSSCPICRPPSWCASCSRRVPASGWRDG